jgi:hypothetical protein
VDWPLHVPLTRALNWPALNWADRRRPEDTWAISPHTKSRALTFKIRYSRIQPDKLGTTSIKFVLRRFFASFLQQFLHTWRHGYSCLLIVSCLNSASLSIHVRVCLFHWPGYFGIFINIKGKAVRQYAYEGAGGRDGIAPTPSRPRHSMGVGSQRHAPAALYSRGKDSRYHCTGGWVGPRAGPSLLYPQWKAWSLKSVCIYVYLFFLIAITLSQICPHALLL